MPGAQKRRHSAMAKKKGGGNSDEESSVGGGNGNRSSLLEPTEQTYAVEKILAKRIFRGKVQYKVRWEGYGPEWDLWRPVSAFLGSNELIEAFERANRKEQKIVRGFRPLAKYAVERGERVKAIHGVDRDDRVGGFIALVEYETPEQEQEKEEEAGPSSSSTTSSEKRRPYAEMVPTSVLAEDEGASQLLLDFYEAHLTLSPPAGGPGWSPTPSDD